MKPIHLLTVALFFTSCSTPGNIQDAPQPEKNSTEVISHSLFNDKSATISEEHIKNILDGTLQLPKQMKVAIVKLQQDRKNPVAGYYYDEDYIKTQQSLIDTLINELNKTTGVTETVLVPELLVSATPGFTILREAAVRMQADVLIVYSLTGDVYNKYKVFTKTDVKAFSTLQLMLMDVRTGLIPFTTIVTRDTLSRKSANEADIYETRRRVENMAATMTVIEAGKQLRNFLEKK